MDLSGPPLSSGLCLNLVDRDHHVNVARSRPATKPRSGNSVEASPGERNWPPHLWPHQDDPAHGPGDAVSDTTETEVDSEQASKTIFQR